MKRYLVLLVVLALAHSASALIYGPEMIANNGFEDGDAPWTYGNASTYRSAASARTGDFGLQMDPTASYWSTASQNITLFRGRMYYYTGRCKSVDGYISANRMLLDGNQLFSVAMGAGWWNSGYGGYSLSGSGQATVVLQIRSTVGHNQTTVYWDDLSLKMESSTPVVTADSLAGDLLVGAPATFSLFNEGGNDSASYAIHFDPDIAVSAVNATDVSIQWVSDTEAQVTLTPTAVGTVALTLTNVLSERSFNYEVQAVPEPITMLLLGLGGCAVLRRR